MKITISSVELWLVLIAVAWLSGCAQAGSGDSSVQPATFASTDLDLTTGTPVTLSGRLLRPAGPGPFPAIVLMHSCRGLLETDRRDGLV